MLIIPLVTKIAELFLILFAAAALVKLYVVKSEDSRVLSRISLYFITPCVVFNSFRKELTPEISGRGICFRHQCADHAVLHRNNPLLGDGL